MPVLKNRHDWPLLVAAIVSGTALGADGDRGFGGIWKSTGPDQIELQLKDEGGTLSGGWTLPYDADGKPARLTLRLKGPRRKDQVMGTYEVRVETLGSADKSAEMNGTIELNLINQGQGIRLQLWLEEENGEPQRLEFRRFEKGSAVSDTLKGARPIADP